MALRMCSGANALPPQEKQADSIVEKLCQRFKMVSEERQWRDIAFCMSLLPFRTEKSMKKLVEVRSVLFVEGNMY